MTEAIVVRHMREVARVPIGSGSSKIAIDPLGVGVNPTNGRVYISNTHAGTVTVLGLPKEDE